jgi:hypothetical protein
MPKKMPFTATAPGRVLSPSAPMAQKQLLTLPVIKDALLIFQPIGAWNRLATAPRSVPFILVANFLPLLLLAAAAEGFGLMSLGRHHVSATAIHQLTWGRIFAFEIFSAVAMLLLVLTGAAFVKMFGNTCHRRNTLAQSLTLLLHALGPLLFVQLLNALPGMNPWVTWAVGVALVLGALYNGLPRIMQPDAPSALGLFLGSAFVVAMLLFLVRFFSIWYLLRQFKPHENILSVFTMNLF